LKPSLYYVYLFFQAEDGIRVRNVTGVQTCALPIFTAMRLAGDSGIGRVVSPFMHHIAEDLDQLNGQHGVRIVRSAIELLSTLIRSEERRVGKECTARTEASENNDEYRCIGKNENQQ